MRILVVEDQPKIAEFVRQGLEENGFSADASHELKTPLAVMQGTLERALAQGTADSEEQRVYSSLLDEVRHQRSIVDNLLLLARADAGQLQISRERLDLSALMENLLEDAGILAEGRGIGVESAIDPGVQVDGDPVLLQQVLHNLFANAVKYNRDGGEVKCVLSAGKGRCEIRISNTGEGISAGDRERVFDRFFRTGTGQSTGPESAGLGLSLCREIVLAHGGTIEVAGNGTEGWTTLRVILPLASQAAPGR